MMVQEEYLGTPGVPPRYVWGRVNVFWLMDRAMVKDDPRGSVIEIEVLQ